MGITAVEVTEDDVQKILTKLKGLPESASVTFEMRPLAIGTTPGFLGDHFLLKLFSEGKEVDELFLKAVPRNIEKRMEFIQETGFFEREIKFYDYFIPLLNSISSSSWSPMCYLSKPDHFIVLKNLKNYRTFSSRLQVFDYQHFKAVMRTLATFHASSIIYEERFGKLTKNEMQLLEEVSHPRKEGNVRTLGLEKIINVFSELTYLIPKYKNSPALTKIIQKLPETVRFIYDYVETSRKYKNVISHGDLWINNVMFKYDEKYSRVSKCKLIDFQFARYSPPAVDITTILYASTTKEFRGVYYNEMLDTYCNQLERELSRHGIDQSIVLPREEIFKSVIEYKKGGIVEALLFAHQTLLPSDTASNLMKSSEEYEKFISECRIEQCKNAFENDYYYRTRITEMLSELIDEFVIR